MSAKNTPLSRRTLLATLGALPAAGLLAGCSADETANLSATSATRSVTDASGASVQVPANPSKVVVLHYAGTQAMMDLGLNPIGTGPAGQHGDDGEPYVPPELWARLKDVPIVVDQGTPQIETIAAMEPDLILAPNITKPEMATQLQALAPVFQFTLRGGRRKDWQGRVEEVADALNQTDRFEQLRTEFATELEINAKEYAEQTKGLVTAVIASYEDGTFYAWGQDNMQGTILTPLGLSWSPAENAAVAGEKEPERQLSMENLLPTIGDADLIFYDTNIHDEAGSGLPRVQASPMYQQLPAVQKGNAFPFGKNTVAGFSDARFSMNKVLEGIDTYRP